MGETRTMKRFFMLLSGILLAVLLYANLYGYELLISDVQLQEKINAKLPYSKRYYVILEATLDNAQVELRQNQVHIQFDARLAALNPKQLLKRVVNNSTISLLSGQVNVVATPEYRMETGQVFLSEVKVVGVNIAGMNDNRKLNRAVRQLVTDYLAMHPVYTLRENDTKKKWAKKFLKAVTVKNHSLILIFGI